MSAFASASGPNALSAFPTVALRREGAATANVHAGTVLPEKNSVPSPRWRPHLHRSAAARTAASRTPRPATTNEGRKGANRVTVSPAAVRTQLSTPPPAFPRAGPPPSPPRPPRGPLRLAPGSRLPAQRPQEEGRSEVKRSRAGLPPGEPRTKAPSAAGEPAPGAPSA